MKYSLELVVFLCGAMLMVLEITGSRVLAPFVGTALPVWTALIGIILLFLSLGYWWGGNWADQHASRKKLALVIAGASASVLYIAIFGRLVLTAIQADIDNIYTGSILATLALFALPSFLLGIVSPYAARLKIIKLASSGATIGQLYAISTLGSIVGTFAAGFWLIPFLGTNNILFLISGLLLLASWMALLGTKRPGAFKGLLLLATLGPMALSSTQVKASNLVADVDTAYSRIWVFEQEDWQSKRPTRYLTNSPQAIQAGMFIDEDNDLVSRYLKYYRLADFFNPNIQKALALGGAGYAYPKDFLRQHSQATLDVVEIDPGMTELAREYFNLPDDPRMTIYHQDARVFLNQNQKIYDAIYVDVFNSDGNLPYQMSTIEAVQKLADSVTENGVVITNIISAVTAPKNKFLQAEFATYSQVFSQVYLFRVHPYPTDIRQNLILVAFKKTEPVALTSNQPEWQDFLNFLWKDDIPQNLPVLTDDFAPVDYYSL